MKRFIVFFHMCFFINYAYCVNLYYKTNETIDSSGLESCIKVSLDLGIHTNFKKNIGNLRDIENLKLNITIHRDNNISSDIIKNHITNLRKYINSKNIDFAKKYMISESIVQYTNKNLFLNLKYFDFDEEQHWLPRKTLDNHPYFKKTDSPEIVAEKKDQISELEYIEISSKEDSQSFKYYTYNPCSSTLYHPIELILNKLEGI